MHNRGKNMGMSKSLVAFAAAVVGSFPLVACDRGGTPQPSTEEEQAGLHQAAPSAAISAAPSAAMGSAGSDLRKGALDTQPSEAHPENAASSNTGAPATAPSAGAPAAPGAGTQPVASEPGKAEQGTPVVPAPPKALDPAPRPESPKAPEPLPEDTKAAQAERSVGSCVLPRVQGIPRKLEGFELGFKASKTNTQKEGELAELCLGGLLLATPEGDKVRYLRAWQECGQSQLNCANLKPYADALTAAWGVGYKKIGEDYVFQTADSEARLGTDLRDGSEALQLRITQVHPDTICHERDGFKKFNNDFLRALRAAKPEEMAQFFSFPFVDELKDRVEKSEGLAAKTEKEFLAHYERFFAKQRRASAPHGVPGSSGCEMNYGGYLDPSWQTGGMVAEKKKGQWHWSKRAYMP